MNEMNGVDEGGWCEQEARQTGRVLARGDILDARKVNAYTYKLQEARPSRGSRELAVS